MIIHEILNSLPLVIDRGISRYLDMVDFVSFRRTCRCHYNDLEAWSIRSSNLPVRISFLNNREIIALHYLLQCSMQFPYQIGTKIWYQQIVDWLEYNSSIRIMSLFFIEMNFIDFDLSNVSVRKRYLWLKQNHRYQSQRVYKIENITYYNDIYECCSNTDRYTDSYNDRYDEYSYNDGYYPPYNEEEFNTETRPTKRRKRHFQSIRTPQPCR